MIRNSIDPKDRTFAEDFRLLSKNIGKNLSENLNGKNSRGMLAFIAVVSESVRQKLLDHAKQSATGALKTASALKAEATTGDLIDNKVKKKIRKNLPQSTDCFTKRINRKYHRICVSIYIYIYIYIYIC